MSGGRQAVFLDRDGTVMEEGEYLSDPDGVRLIPGAAGAIRALRDAGLAVVVVTNQSGIARGLLTPAQYEAVRARLDEALARAGAALDATYHCPHHPDFTGPCACRKPAPGMYLRAARELGLELAGSWYVGDRASDVLPALRLGGGGVLVRTGYGAGEAARVPQGVEVVQSLPEAAAHILRSLG